MEPRDSELLVRWQSGDSRAGKLLIERYYATIEGFFVNKVSLGVADLTQETFRVFLENAGQIKDPESVRSYLFSIAYNKLRELYRERGRFYEEFDEGYFESLLPNVEEILADAQTEALLLRALVQLPPQYQEVLALHYWEDCKLAEIAEIIGTNENTIKMRLKRARLALNRILRKIAVEPVPAEDPGSLETWVAQVTMSYRDS